jgi:hypothetical protein
MRGARDGLYVVYILHITTVASQWVARTLHLPPPVELSHDPTRGLGRLGLATLLRCIVLRIVGLLALEAQRVVHTAGSSNDWLGAALVLAALAPSMRLAVLRAACSSPLGAAQVLAALASAVRDAVPRIA